MGVRRKIDFLLCHVSLSVHAAAASHEFDMGSDHGAVYGCIDATPTQKPMQDVLADIVDGAQIRRRDDDLRRFAANYFNIDDWLDRATFSHQWRVLRRHYAF